MWLYERKWKWKIYHHEEVPFYIIAYVLSCCKVDSSHIWFYKRRNLIGKKRDTTSAAYENWNWIVYLSMKISHVYFMDFLRTIYAQYICDELKGTTI